MAGGSDPCCSELASSIIARRWLGRAVVPKSGHELYCSCIICLAGACGCVEQDSEIVRTMTSGLSPGLASGSDDSIVVFARRLPKDSFRMDVCERLMGSRGTFFSEDEDILNLPYSWADQ